MSTTSTRARMKDELKAIAKDFWAGKGAKYGHRQKVSDIDLSDQTKNTEIYYADLPARFTPDTEFMTDDATCEPYRSSFGGDYIILALWVYPFKKNGELYQNPIRLTFLMIN